MGTPLIKKLTRSLKYILEISLLCYGKYNGIKLPTYDKLEFKECTKPIFFSEVVNSIETISEFVMLFQSCLCGSQDFKQGYMVALI